MCLFWEKKKSFNFLSYFFFFFISTDEILSRNDWGKSFDLFFTWMIYEIFLSDCVGLENVNCCNQVMIFDFFMTIILIEMASKWELLDFFEVLKKIYVTRHMWLTNINFFTRIDGRNFKKRVFILFVKCAQNNRKILH